MARLDDAGGGNSGRSGTAASFSSGHVAEVLATPPVARKQDPRENKLWFLYLASGMEEGEYASLPSAVIHGTATVTPSEKKCSQENTAFLDGMPMLPQ